MPANSNGELATQNVVDPSRSQGCGKTVPAEAVTTGFEPFEIEFFERGYEDTTSPIEQEAIDRPRRGAISFWPLLSRLPLRVIVKST